jgi:hypothetical protein
MLINRPSGDHYVVKERPHMIMLIMFQSVSSGFDSILMIKRPLDRDYSKTVLVSKLAQKKTSYAKTQLCPK